LQIRSADDDGIAGKDGCTQGGFFTKIIDWRTIAAHTQKTVKYRRIFSNRALAIYSNSTCNLKASYLPSDEIFWADLPDQRNMLKRRYKKDMNFFVPQKFWDPSRKILRGSRAGTAYGKIHVEKLSDFLGRFFPWKKSTLEKSKPIKT
jgi:hypothetical protein